MPRDRLPALGWNLEYRLRPPPGGTLQPRRTTAAVRSPLAKTTSAAATQRSIRVTSVVPGGSGREIYRGKAGERQKTYSERISGIPAGWPLPQPKTPTSWEAGFATLSPLPKTQHYNQTPNTKPKPDTSYAMKTGLFNLLTTSRRAQAVKVLNCNVFDSLNRPGAAAKIVFRNKGLSAKLGSRLY